MLHRLARVLILPCLLIFAFVTPAAAQLTFTVNNGGDGTDNFIGNNVCATVSGVCTLRAAIQEANNSAVADTINFSVSVVTLTRTGVDDTAVNGDLDITNPVTINGANAMIVNRTGERTFQIISGLVQVNDLQVTAVRTGDNGGAFMVSSTLILDNVHMHHINANDGMAVFAANGTSINILNSSITNNTGSSGALYNSGAATFTVVNTTISNNFGTAVGGVFNISNTGDFSRFEHVTITENLTLGSTATDAGGILTLGDFGPVFKNSILSGNDRRFSGPPGIDCATNLASNHLISQGGNVFGSLINCTVTYAGDRNTFDEGLDPLTVQLFSGNAFHLPQALSPALFLGQECQAQDQNGDPRPANDCTAGAIEAPLLLLTTNGGFENGLSGWTVAGTSVKAKDVDPLAGLKHLELKGGSTSIRTVSQKITLDPFTTPVPEFVVVDLYYQAVSGTSILSISLEFKREFGEKVKLKLPVVNDTLERLPEDYRRATYRLLVDQRVTDEPILTDPRATPPPSSVTFKLVDSSLSGKLYVDDIRVYFYGGEVQPGGGARGADPGTRGLPLLPPPLIPDGFRGKN